MTGDQQGRDPVEQFFAAHRAQVREEPADDLTWQRVRDGHRDGRSRRRRAWGGGLVAAAAALALVAGPSLLPDAEAPDVAGPSPSVTEPTTSPTYDPGRPSASTPPPTSAEEPRVVTTQAPEGELPSDGRVTDVTTADPEPGTDTGVRYAVLMRPCDSQGWCALLAFSADGGLTWAPRADLEELGMVHRVRFIDHQRGWVWGDKAQAWATTDGGRTWSTVDTGADYLADLSVQGDQLLATTLSYQDCTGEACGLPLGSVVLTDPTDTQWGDDVTRELGPVEQAAILGWGDLRYVLTSGGDRDGVTVLRLQEGVLESTAPLEACGSGPVAVTASRDTGGEASSRLYALCEDQRGLSLQVSPNSARTWEPANITVPSFVLGEQPPLLASTGTGHLLLIGEGNYTVSTDGGRTWSTEAFLPGADARPERLEVTPFGEIIAFPTPEQASADLGYWRSVDGGQTWEVVPLVR